MDKQLEAVVIAILLLATGFLLSQKLILLAVLLMIVAFILGLATGLIKA